MRKIQKLFIVLFTLVLCFGISTIPAFAASVSQDGLEVTLVTDKTAYEQDEQITATLVVLNTNEQPVSNVSLKHLVPDGYELADGSTDTKEIESIAANDYVSFEVVYGADTDFAEVAAGNANDDEKNNDIPGKGTSPLTGQTANIVLGIAVFAVAGVLLVVLLRLKKDKRTKALSIALSVVIAGSTTAFVVGQAYAADSSQKNISVETQVTVAGEELTLCAQVAYVPVSEIDMEKDSDSDGVSDIIEQALGTDPNKSDTDGDGLTDSEELQIGTDPTLTDTDSDGVWDGDEDADGDGLTNLEEIKLGTDPTQQDTDTDGLTDYEEQYTYSTDPTNEDTDGDGATDGWEVSHGYDPLTPNAHFDVSVSSEAENIKASVTLQVSGEQASTVQVEETDQELFIDETVPGYIGSAFDFSVNGSFEEATISFTFDESLLTDLSFVPAIYYWNEETQMFEELATTVSGNVASTKVTHFSTYILLNKTEFDQVWNTEIKPPNYEEEFSGLDVVFVIDSSGSMSSNDYNELRLEAAKQFVAKLGDKDRAAVIDFDNYASLYQAFTSDHEALNNAIDRIDDSGGTNLSSGISLAINQFTSDAYDRTDAAKYIIFLTDGDGSYSTSYTQTAANNGITIYTIGLGSGVRESTLRSIAEGTGGKYYFASTPDVLLGIYNEISLETVDYQTDSNNDGISDYFTRLLCDGTLLLGTGKDNPFKGYSYDDVQKNDDFDGDDLKNGEELVVTAYASLNRVYVQMLSDPTTADTDFDGIDDKDEISKSARLSNRFEADVKYSTDGHDYDTEASFKVDYRWFFENNQVYNQGLAILASLYSLDMYSDGWLELNSGAKGSSKSKNGVTLGKIFGLDDGENFKASDFEKYSLLDSAQNSVDSDDVSEVYIAHKLVSYNGEKREVFFLVVRGTNGKNEEWSSNFDIGANTANYEKRTGEHPDWKNKENHKGFDVTANRILNAFNSYLDNNKGTIDSDAEKSIFITGHSRGAAIANILGAYFEDDFNYDPYVYTFAAPNTTTSPNASDYQTIFNIVNTDDMVPFLPLKAWGFDKYGETLCKNISYDLNVKYYFMFGEYNGNEYLNSALNSFEKIAGNREEYYQLDSSATVQEGMLHIDEQAIVDFKATLKDGKLDKYCVSVKEDTFPIGYYIKVTYSPAYVAQLIANLAGKIYEDDITNIKTWLLVDLSGDYSSARLQFVLASGKIPSLESVGGMTCPHMPGSYYLIASQVPYDQFSHENVPTPLIKIID
ncbi:MAG TPA: VWA domain-containing protein [Candidatus Scubalenecus merdavium]|uniref:VWA domain-containing protein n=1 Tax=Candidatus Scybalenecus merdavium TaxID=2840939 RepID=A0A9D1SNY4_9FIRM|nr:VWA domain-containing protein [Candidatus Scubalenecus merdavium]